MLIRRSVFLLTVIFIAGLFIMMPAVSYGDGIVEDWKTKDGNTAASEESGDDYFVSVAAPDGGVNFRSGPGVSYDKLQSDMISNGTELRIEKVEEDNLGRNWGYTEYGGKHGWIYLPQTKKVKKSESTSDNSASSSDSTPVDYNVEVKAPDGGVNFRSGPGATFDKLQNNMISNGTVLHVEKVAEDNLGRDWGYTEYDGKHGWFYLSQTKKVNKSESASDNSASSDSTPVDYNVEVKATDGGVNFRSGPGVSFDKLQSNMIANGTVLHISRTAGATNGKEWGYTEYNSMKGWIYLGQTVVTTATVTNSTSKQTQTVEKSKTETKSEVEEDSSTQSDSDVSTGEQSRNTNSNMSFIIMLIVFIIGLVILALIITVVVLLTRRNDIR